MRGCLWTSLNALPASSSTNAPTAGAGIGKQPLLGRMAVPSMIALVTDPVGNGVSKGCCTSPRPTAAIFVNAGMIMRKRSDERRGRWPRALPPCHAPAPPQGGRARVSNGHGRVLPRAGISDFARVKDRVLPRKRRLAGTNPPGRECI